MKNWFLGSLVLATLVVAIQGCGPLKKEEAAAPAPVGCGQGTVYSPGFSTCVVRGQCPRGMVQSPTQASMCADINTGNNIMPQQCGPGYVLTAFGCFQQGYCPAGQAQIGDACKPAASNTGGYSTSSPFGAAGSMYSNGMPYYGPQIMYPYGAPGY